MTNAALEKKLAFLQGLKKLCTGAMVFGLVTSAGGNVLHSRMHVISIAIALLAPALLFLAFEMMSRIPFRKEAHWLGKVTRIVATAAIAGVMAVISYSHQKDAFLVWSDSLSAYLLPGAIDAMMVIGSVSVIELNIQIQNLSAVITSGAASNTRKPKDADIPRPKKEKELSGRERIAQILARSPELSATEVAKLANVKVPYAYNVMGELRKAQELQTA